MIIILIQFYNECLSSTNRSIITSYVFYIRNGLVIDLITLLVMYIHINDMFV